MESYFVIRWHGKDYVTKKPKSDFVYRRTDVDKAVKEGEPLYEREMFKSENDAERFLIRNRNPFKSNVMWEGAEFEIVKMFKL